MLCKTNKIHSHDSLLKDMVFHGKGQHELCIFQLQSSIYCLTTYNNKTRRTG